MKPCRGLNGTELKLLAAALMLCDHAGAILFPQVLWLRCIGRPAFPLFAFLVAEGYIHTRNFKNYLRRMALFALLSEIPFNLIQGSLWNVRGQNVLVTFCIALLTLRGLDAIQRITGWEKYAGTAAVTAAGWLCGQVLHSDYGGWGVFTVVLFYLCRDGKYAKICLLIGMAAVNCLCLSSFHLTVCGIPLPIQALALAALPLLWLYNGLSGAKGRWRWAFYAFYPVHLLLLEGIRAIQ